MKNLLKYGVLGLVLLVTSNALTRTFPIHEINVIYGKALLKHPVEVRLTDTVKAVKDKALYLNRRREMGSELNLSIANPLNELVVALIGRSINPISQERRNLINSNFKNLPDSMNLAQVGLDDNDLERATFILTDK